MADVEAAASPFAIPAFRLFLFGRVVSMLGSAMAPVALAFAVLDHSARVLDLGIVLAARSIPSVVFILVGGAVADRFSRRTVLRVSNYGAAATQAIAAAVLIHGSFNIALISALEFCNGTLAAFTSPAMRGVIPQLLPENAMQKANSILSTSRSAIAVGAPTVAGLVVAGFGGGWALAFDALTFFVAAACFGLLRLPRPIRGAGSILGDLRDGWTAFTSYTWVWVIVTVFAGMNFIQAGVWNTLGPAIAKQTIGETGWGATLSAKAAGLLVISLVLYRLRIHRVLVAAQLAVAAIALPMLGLALLANTPSMMAAAFVAGLGTGLFGIMWDTALQTQIPNHQLSRVSSYDDLGSFIAIPLGQLVVGPVALIVGAGPVALTGAVLYVILAVIPLLVPAVRNLTSAKNVPTS